MATFNVQRSIPVWNQNREQDRDQERERKGDCFIRKTFVALLTSLVKEYGFFWFESTTEPWSGLWSITSSIYVKDPRIRCVSTRVEPRGLSSLPPWRTFLHPSFIINADPTTAALTESLAALGGTEQKVKTHRSICPWVGSNPVLIGPKKTFLITERCRLLDI
ncbi:hypothetical protein EVAR_100405_1 [Eumeta japonica]|uniref:Uncharacterized protein n=1 Tax=Eumeta variegata TaxID=151549 RepID=A0A4C1ZVG6_EUMVA|nr:hypothetical protein EVAR_100405_1 [Eumeta japonica]